MSDDDYPDVKSAWRELGDEPLPRALDARVREMARAAVAPDVGTGTHAAEAAPAGAVATNVVDLQAQRKRRRWVVPASLAASVVLAFGLAQRVQEQSPAGAANVAASLPATRATAPAESAAPANAEATSATAASTRELATRAEAADAAPRAAKTAPRTYAPPPRVLDGEYSAQAPVAAPAAEPALAPVTVPAPERERRDAPERRAPQAFPTQQIAPAAAMRALPPELPSAAPVPPAASAGASATAAASAAVGAEMRADSTPSAESAPAMERADAVASKRERERAATQRTPEAWLADIEALRRAGRTAEAEAELARFRAAYPDRADR